MFKTRGGSKAIWTMLKKLRFWWMMASLRKQVFELRLFARITEQIMATWRPEVDLPWDDTSQDSQLAMLRPFHLRVIFRPSSMIDRGEEEEEDWGKGWWWWRWHIWQFSLCVSWWIHYRGLSDAWSPTCSAGLWSSTSSTRWREIWWYSKYLWMNKNKGL